MMRMRRIYNNRPISPAEYGTGSMILHSANHLVSRSLSNIHYQIGHSTIHIHMLRYKEPNSHISHATPTAIVALPKNPAIFKFSPTWHIVSKTLLHTRRRSRRCRSRSGHAADHLRTMILRRQFIDADSHLHLISPAAPRSSMRHELYPYSDYPYPYLQDTGS